MTYAHFPSIRIDVDAVAHHLAATFWS